MEFETEQLIKMPQEKAGKKIRCRAFYLFILILSMIYGGLYGQSFVSDNRVDVSFVSEINRSLSYCWNVSAKGMAELFELVVLRGGLSLGKTGSRNMDIFAHTGVRIPALIPVSFNAAYIFNALPEYKTSIHSVIPFAAFSLGKFDLTLGYCFRMTWFGGESLLNERCFAYKILFNLLDTDQGKLSLYAGNFSDFMCGNAAAYNFGLMYSVPVSSRIMVTGGMEFYQAGSFGLAANFYGMSLNGGIGICF